MRRLMVLFMLAGSTLAPKANHTAHAATITLPRTGQSACFDADGNTLACAGTGQDAEKQIGVAWPAPRFSDNGNGTLTDNLTGLVWLKHANCFGSLTWQQALTAANSLTGHEGQCDLNDGSSSGQWRLPNREELLSLVTYQQILPADWLNLQGFVSVQPEYWTSDSYTPALTGSTNKWTVHLGEGYTYFASAGSLNNVWAVRDIAGVCGSSNGGTFDTPPVNNLCLEGTPSVSGDWTWECIGSSTAYCSASIQTYWLSVTFSGNGTGQIHSSPADVSCFSGIHTSCSAQFTYGDVVTLIASPDSSTSIFEGWGGDCPGGDTCTFPMLGHRAFTPSFSLAPMIKLDIADQNGYDTLDEAYDAASGTLYAMDTVLEGEWALDGGKDIVLRGGYRADFTARTGYTTIKVKDKLVIKNGSLRVDGVKLSLQTY